MDKKAEDKNEKKYTPEMFEDLVEGRQISNSGMFMFRECEKVGHDVGYEIIYTDKEETDSGTYETVVKTAKFYNHTKNPSFISVLLARGIINLHSVYNYSEIREKIFLEYTRVNTDCPKYLIPWLERKDTKIPKDMSTLLQELFGNDTLVDGKFSCQFIEQQGAIRSYITDIPKGRETILYIVNLGGKKYLQEYLRKYMAYIIVHDEKTSNYTLMNRDYEYLHEGFPKYIEELSGWKRIYLFNDGTNPTYSKENFKKYLHNLSTTIVQRNSANTLVPLSRHV